MTLYIAREIDLAVPTARQTLDKILAGYERSGGAWDAAINCGYFDAARAYGDIVFWSRRFQDNHQPWPYLVIGLDGRARVAEASPRIDPASVRHAIQIGPWLVRGGRPTEIGLEIERGRYTGLRPGDRDKRTIIGIRADGRVVAGVVTGTLPEAQRALLDAGCVSGLYSDGGGSSALIVRGKGTQIGSLSRAIPAAIVLRGIEALGQAPTTPDDPDEQAPAPGQPDDRYYVGPVENRQLSRNFNLREFASRDTSAQVIVSLKLVDLLQRLRDRIGVPLHINSGYRTVAHNRAVNGATYSQHQYGRAADVWAKGYTVDQLADLGREIGFTGILRYPTFVHLDCRAGPRVERDYR